LRYLIAEKFKDHIGSKNVENINQDFLEVNHLKNLDLVNSVDITFKLIAALNKQAESQGLKWIYDSLRPGGFLVLELRFLKNSTTESVKQQKIINSGKSFLSMILLNLYWLKFIESQTTFLFGKSISLKEIRCKDLISQIFSNPTITKLSKLL